MLRKIAKVVGWTILLFILGNVGFVLWFQWSSAAFVRVPDDRDTRLVGRWTGIPQPWWKVDAYKEMNNKPLETANYELRADGTGSFTYADRSNWARPLVWGTENGVIHVKWFTIDAWAYERFGYTISDGRVYLGKKDDTFFAPVWTRKEPATAQE